MTSDHVNRPLLGEPDAPCRTCGAPLAADQRYCLQCGTRRAEARLPFLEILKGQGPAAARPARAAAPMAPAGHVGGLGRVSSNAVAIAGVACLVLALGVGVLIGNMNDNSAPAAAPAQVIRVGAVSATPSAATTAAPAPTSTTEDAAPERKAARRAAARRAAASKATNSTVRDLGRSSGGDYAKRSARLPDEVGTGGRLPPKRAGTIGAGSDVESIG